MGVFYKRLNNWVANFERAIVTQSPHNTNELREILLSKKYLQGSVDPTLIKALSDYIDRLIVEAEAMLRHKIASQAPDCTHSLVSETEHQAWCGFVNGIWTNWAVKHKAKINPDGKATVEQLHNQEKEQE